MSAVQAKIEKMRLVPMIAIADAADAVPLGEALAAGGLPCAEVTFRTPAAEASLRALVEKGDLLVGAGTVTTIEQVDIAADCGVTFMVSPGTNPRVIERALDRGVDFYPGVCTPTNIETAMSLGLRTLKFFPAGAMGGPATIKAVGGPYGDVKFIPTGGVNPANMLEYLGLKNVIAVGGSWLAPKDVIAAKRFDEIEKTAAQAVELLKEMRR